MELVSPESFPSFAEKLLMNLGEEEEEEEEEEKGEEELGTLLLSLFSLSIRTFLLFPEKLVHPPHLRPKKGKTFSRFANSALYSPLPMYFFEWKQKKGLRAAAATSGSEFLPERERRRVTWW